MILSPSDSKKNHDFANLLDAKSTVNYFDLQISPLTCESSYLPHLALIAGVNIDGMLETEARAYINTFDPSNTGTVGAVKDVVNVCFQDAKLIEWFEVDDLDRGMFRINVNIKADKNAIYDERLFSVSNRLLNNSKNVRSKLKSINLSLPDASLKFNNFCGGVFGAKLRGKFEMIATANLKIKGGVVWMV